MKAELKEEEIICCGCGHAYNNKKRPICPLCGAIEEDFEAPKEYDE